VKLVLALAILAVLGIFSALRVERMNHPIHTRVTATVFWIGEPRGNGSSEDNAISAWDDEWLMHYGGVDDPWSRRTPENDYFPQSFVPKENPFYVDLPYNDFHDSGEPRADRFTVVPWARRSVEGARRAAENRPFSLLKNRWLRLIRSGRVCYAQWEDSGPYVYDDARYVFGTRDERPSNRRAGGAGLDVSPAVRDCLGFRGRNNAENRVSWQFVDAAEVPDGPWRRVVTTRQIFWR
jgi:hypothetical protein